MAKKQEDLAESLLADENGGWLTGFLVDEEFNRRTLWRLGSWGIGSVGAVIVAILAYHTGAGLRHEQIAADLTRQSQQLQSIAKADENETRRLTSAIATLNGDRDRLFARVTVLEQGLDAVTGSINRNDVAQNEPQKASPPIDVALSLPPSLFSEPNIALPSEAGMARSLASSVSTLPTIRPDLPKKSETSKTSVSKAAESSTGAHPSPAIAPVASAAAAETVVAKISAPKQSSPEFSPASAQVASPATDSSAGTPTSGTPLVASKPATVVQDQPAKSGEPNETGAITSVRSEPAKDKEAQKSKDAQIIVASIPDAEPAPAPPDDIPVAHTDFGVDLGSASSIKNLRVLWRKLLKSDARELASLHPIIALKERSNGFGMQLRLVAGPLADAAAAAKICAVLSENGRDCRTAVFDGQRLALKQNADESGTAAAEKKQRPSHASSRHRHSRRAVRAEEPAPPPPAPPPPPQPSTFGSMFSR
ncbi:MAG: hypothetical protein ABI146_04625 [Nitrobacter sp.]